MTFGFKVVTGVGNTVVYDSDTPAPGYILEQFDVPANVTITKNYSTSGCSELLPYAFTYWSPTISTNRGFPKVTINGLSITVENIHPYSGSGWGGIVRVIVLGR